MVNNLVNVDQKWSKNGHFKLKLSLLFKNRQKYHVQSFTRPINLFHKNRVKHAFDCLQNCQKVLIFACKFMYTQSKHLFELTTFSGSLTTFSFRLLFLLSQGISVTWPPKRSKSGQG